MKANFNLENFMVKGSSKENLFILDSFNMESFMDLEK